MHHHHNHLKYTKLPKQQILNILEDAQFIFDDNEKINEEIVEILTSDIEALDKYRVIMQNDIENCYNILDREQSLLNINKSVNDFYNINYSNFGARTKMALGSQILYQKNGGAQGNALAAIVLLINEKDMIK